MAQKVLGFQFSAAAQQSWTADADYLLQAGVTSVAGAIAYVSSDGSLTIAEISGPSATKFLPDMLAIFPSAKPSPQMNVPIVSGSTYFVRAGGAMTVLLYLDPLVPAE